MRSKSWLCSCVLALSMCAGAQTTVSIAPDAASKEDVKKLFDVMASREQMAQMMQQVFAQMRSLNRDEIKKRHPDVTDEELARMDKQSEDLMKNFPLDEMLSDMIPVYQRHFTKSEIEALTAFYSSPAGQKFLHEMPAVTSETMRTVYPRIQAEIEAALKRAEEKTNSPQK
ncbi:MAG TPA: DUF2059 domain-containing protein [Candidatus Sulfotelmatobacter sp.]|jgi:hypothetical protein|nr:DUF2059 domain-containing protein [Candidatus Sulfotelmatobacter sp.]